VSESAGVIAVCVRDENPGSLWDFPKLDGIHHYGNAGGGDQ